MLTSRLKSLAVVAMLAVALVAPLKSVKAQVPSIANPPYNLDIGAVITNTLALAGTVNSATASASTSPWQNNNLNWLGVSCTWTTQSSSGSTSSVFSIQQYDAASATFQTLISSPAIVASSTSEAVNTPHAVVLRPGLAGTAPTNYTYLSLALPRVWRVQAVISNGAGTNPAPAVTSKIGCNYLD